MLQELQREVRVKERVLQQSVQALTDVVSEKESTLTQPEQVQFTEEDTQQSVTVLIHFFFRWLGTEFKNFFPHKTGSYIIRPTLLPLSPLVLLQHLSLMLISCHIQNGSLHEAEAVSVPNAATGIQEARAKDGQ